MDNDTPMPDRKKLEAIVSRYVLPSSLAGLDDLAELVECARWALGAIPKEADFVDVCSQNPLTQVYFRAGLLACREYMARFVEQGGDKTTANSIRTNWWPNLGDDPGSPRRFDFAELCEMEDGPDGKPIFRAREISASVEALPRALQFLEASRPA